MRIETSSVSLISSHSAVTMNLVRESLRVSVVPEARTPEARTPVAGKDMLSLSDQAKVSWPPAEKPDPYNLEFDLDSGLDPEMRMLKALVERLFGIKIKLLSPKDKSKDADGGEAKGKQDSPPATPPRDGPGVSVTYERQETQIESETTTVEARGVIKTSDGKSIDFGLSLTMSRMVVSQSQVSVRAGAVVEDPLVINFAGEAAQLTDARFSFDLNADGSAEKMAFVGPGSGMLVLDRNADGKVNDGRELFGPTTGNGFGELAAHDADGNRWIDEGDPVFDKLRVWSKDGAGQDKLSTLADVGVAAIHLEPVVSQFDLKGSGQVSNGQVRSTGVYLSESGPAGAVQQVDLVV